MRPASLARRIVVFIALVAFALQSFVTQTHIHHDAQLAGGILKSIATPLPVHGKAPLDGQTDCPFCQAVVHAGAFVVSAVPVLYSPFVWVKTAFLILTAPKSLHATTHNWQSRAPPRA